MRASEQEQIGGAGVSEVCAKFQRLGWGPVVNHMHDLGTDLLVQVRDDRGFDRGLIVGVQVKAGPSWFDQVVRDQDGGVSGWWYYEGSTSHFDDWVTHRLPHILVLHDLDSNDSYWVHVTAERVTGTGKGCKIFVPSSQTLDEQQRDKLMVVATEQKAAPPLEGTAFNASAGNVPPSRRIRYALLTPRLVAPHRNLGYDSAISPEEALALCARGRFADLLNFCKRHDTIPNVDQPYKGGDHRWALARALWSWVHSGELEELIAASSSASTNEARAASNILLACAYSKLDRPADAIKLLDDLISQDDFASIDHAWALVQRARFRAELGAIEVARDDAVQAQRLLSGDEDDITASGLASAAAMLLFNTADTLNGDLAGLINASDTAIAWWRSQNISWALNETAQQAFRAWAQDSSERWVSEDTEAINLFAAEFSADITGEHKAWMHVSALSARLRVMNSHADMNIEGVSDALNDLRKSGDHASLKLATAQVRRVGPVDSLVRALQKLNPGNWTHTNTLATLKLLSEAGDFAEEQRANYYTNQLLNVLLSPSAFGEHMRPTFVVTTAVSEAICGLLPACSASVRTRAAEYLAQLDAPVSQIDASRLAQWIAEMDAEEITPDLRNRLRTLANNDGGVFGATVLGKLADWNDQESKEQVLDRAANGDLNALSAMGDATVLSATQAQGLINDFCLKLESTAEQAERGTYSIGAFDAAHVLSLFNIWFPSTARWDELVEFLLHADVAVNDKRAALEVIIQQYEMIPPRALTALANGRDIITASKVVGNQQNNCLDGLGVALKIVSGECSEEEIDLAVIHLALGSQATRCTAATLLAHGWSKRMRPLLASLVSDSRIRVRHTAALAVGRLAASEPDPVVVELARKIVHEPNAMTPPAVLVGLSREKQDSGIGRELARSLQTHSSARVRKLASDFLAYHA